MNLKKTLLAFALIGGIPVMISADEVYKGDQVNVTFASMTQIQEHQANIARDAYHRLLAVRATKGAIGISCLLACYMTFKDLKIVDATVIGQYNVISAQYLAAFIQKNFPDKGIVIPDPRAFATGWKDTLWNFGSFICQGIAASQIQSFLYEQLQDRSSIEYFAQHKTVLHDLYQEIDSLKEDVSYLKQGLMFVTEYQADRYVSSLIRLHNAFVKEAELVIGYIQYKAEHVQHQGAARLYGDTCIGGYLYKRINDVADQLHTMQLNYHKHTNDTERLQTIVTMFNLIQSLSIEFNSAVLSFKRFEVQIESV